MTPVIVTAKATGTTMVSYTNADMKYMAIVGLITLLFLICLIAYNYIESKKS